MGKYAYIFSKFSQKNILVIGDIILDKYVRGIVSRISPEAPVPIVLEKESFSLPGGAANVAHNLHGLGAKVTIIGRIGDDPEGQVLVRKFKEQGFNTRSIFVDKKIL